MSFNRFHKDDSSFAVDTNPDAPPEGDRWSSWDSASHGPKPRPDWIITDLGAVEEDLGVLKTGKEADVHLVRRWIPGDPGRDVLMAGKRYRSSKHRLFHRDAGYLEGRRVRKSRETRAMATRTSFGKELISGLWAFADSTAQATEAAITNALLPKRNQKEITSLIEEGFRYGLTASVRPSAICFSKASSAWTRVMLAASAGSREASRTTSTTC